MDYLKDSSNSDMKFVRFRKENRKLRLKSRETLARILKVENPTGHIPGSKQADNFSTKEQAVKMSSRSEENSTAKLNPALDQDFEDFFPDAEQAAKNPTSDEKDGA